MYKTVVLSHIVRIPPTKFGTDIKNAAFEILSERFNGQIMEEIGFIIMVIDVKDPGNGKILHGDAATYHPVEFTVLCYNPEMHEVVEGTVVEVVEFGAFIRLGPSDGLCHVSQLLDDFVVHESMQSRFYAKESNKILTVNDIVRARIIAISIASGRSGKLGLTMRQPYLGKIDWIEDQILGETGESPDVVVEDD